MDLHTNWHKTKIQNIGTGDASRTVHIDNQAVETVSKFTYLGCDIDSEGYSYPEVHRRLGIAGSIMAQLDNVWRPQRLSLSTKLRIYRVRLKNVPRQKLRFLKNRSVNLHVIFTHCKERICTYLDNM